MRVVVLVLVLLTVCCVIATPHHQHQKTPVVRKSEIKAPAQATATVLQALPVPTSGNAELELKLNPIVPKPAMRRAGATYLKPKLEFSLSEAKYVQVQVPHGEVENSESRHPRAPSILQEKALISEQHLSTTEVVTSKPMPATREKKATTLTATQTSATNNKVEPGVNVLLVATSMGAGKKYCDLTESNHQKYADKHGYGYKRYHDKDLKALGVAGDVKWAKMSALVENLDGSHKYVVWIDCDMVVTNPDHTIEEIFTKYASSSTRMLIARDAWYKKKPQEAAINSGIFLMLDDPWSKEFAQSVFTKGKIPGSVLEDQPRIIAELVERGEMNATPEAEIEHHEHVTVIPQRVMNSFLREGDYYDDQKESIWQPGDFIAHVNGMSNDLRCKYIRELLERGDVQTNLSLLQGVVHGDVMSLIQAEGRASILSESALADTATLDRIEANWKHEMIRALVAEDWETVRHLQLASN